MRVSKNPAREADLPDVDCARKWTFEIRNLAETLDRLSQPCPLYGIQEDAQGSPRFRETPVGLQTMPLTQEATVGFPRPGLPPYGPGNPRSGILQALDPPDPHNLKRFAAEIGRS